MIEVLALVSLQVLQIPHVPRVLQAPQVSQIQQVPQAGREVVADVLVHGNQIVPDAEVLTIAGVAIGAPFSDAVLAAVTKRLRDSGKFASISVIKRFASIEDASRIIVVIIVSEGPVRMVVPTDPGRAVEVKKRSFIRNLMFAPLLETQDGYGLTAGARVAYPHPIGPNSQLSFPMTWGRTKRIGVELTRTFDNGPFSRIEFGGTVLRRWNPFFDEQDDRLRVWARALRSMGPVRAGGTVGWQHVVFGAMDDTLTSVGVDVTLDTRANPALPRNAVLVSASAERLFFGSGRAITRTRLEATGYLGLVGEQVVTVHAVREGSDSPQPPYLRSILGGWTTLRGFKTGFLTGDTLVAGSVEWRVPIVSPMPGARVGVSAFADWGAAYDYGRALRDQSLHHSLGGTVWFSLASLRLAMAVGYGFGSGTRVHFTGTMGF